MIRAGSPSAPALKGIVGRKPGAMAGYAFSPALKAKGGTWTDASLDAYLANPSAAIPGTKMFAADHDAAERAAIIAYLKTLK